MTTLDDYCDKCGAARGTENGQCSIDWGGSHAETDMYSNDWHGRWQRSEHLLEESQKRVTALESVANELQAKVDSTESKLATLVEAARALGGSAHDPEFMALQKALAVLEVV